MITVKIQKQSIERSVRVSLNSIVMFGFYWVRVSFFFSSDSRAGLGLGRFGVGFWVGLRARAIFPHRERALHFPGPGPRAPFKF